MESVAQLQVERDQYAAQIQEEGRVWKDKTEQLLSQVKTLCVCINDNNCFIVQYNYKCFSLQIWWNSCHRFRSQMHIISNIQRWSSLWNTVHILISLNRVLMYCVCRCVWCQRRGTAQLLRSTSCRRRSQNWRTLQVQDMRSTFSPSCQKTKQKSPKHALHKYKLKTDSSSLTLFRQKHDRFVLCPQLWWVKSRSCRPCHRSQALQKVNWPFRKPSAAFSRRETLSVYSTKHRWPALTMWCMLCVMHLLANTVFVLTHFSKFKCENTRSCNSYCSIFRLIHFLNALHKTLLTPGPPHSSQ